MYVNYDNIVTKIVVNNITAWTLSVLWYVLNSLLVRLSLVICHFNDRYNNLNVT